MTLHRLGLGVQGGGGVAGFSNRQMQALTDHGGYWEARVTAGLRQIFALEVAYLGAANPIGAEGVGTGASLVGHGGEADLRVNLPLVSEESFMAPYVLGGMGWMHYRVAGASNDGTMLASADDIAVLPVGAGVTFGHGHLYLDARAVYRFTAHEDLVRTPDASSGQLRQWTVGGSVGFVF
jgi:hypothetical protein